MGSPLSPILANIFLEFYERDKLATVFDINANTWLRYVDDVFIILPETININQLIEQINSLHPSIQFTYELGYNNSLPFLDTLVIKDQISSKFLKFTENIRNLMHIFILSHIIAIKSKQVL